MKWVTMWGNAQSKVIPQAATYAKNITLRYPIYVPFNGNKIRIELDNYCVNEEVTINKVAVGISNKLDYKCEFYSYLSFKGKREVTIDSNSSIKSDELEINLKENQYLVVSLYISYYTNLSGGVDIIGPLSKGYFAYGDYCESYSLDINTYKSTSWVHFLSNIDIYTSDNNYAIICFGDSITSQDWPDYMQIELKNKGINNVSVVRKAVSGTRILRQYDCILYQSYGLKGENRFNHEIASVSGAKKIIIQHGINDIIHPVGTDINIYRPLSDMPTLQELKNGILYYLEELKKYDLDYYVGTLLPIYNWRTYNKDKEDFKNEFNKWLLTLNNIDFSNEVSIYNNEAYQFKNNCDSGDHLHPSKYAYELMGKLAVKKIFNL